MDFTVIIPVYNGGAKIGLTIDSIINQTGILRGDIGLRLIVVDGASDDDTVEVAKSFDQGSLEVISEPDTGMYDALAKGLEQASGDVTCYMPAGDRYDPHAFETVAEILSGYSEISWLTGRSTLRNHRGQIIGSRLPHSYYRRLFLNGTYGTTLWPLMQECTFWRTPLNQHIDLERLRTFKAAGDFFLWWSFAAHEDLFVADTIFAAFTVEDGQLSSRMASTYRDEILSVARRPTFMEKLAAWRMKRPHRRFVPRVMSKRLLHWNHVIGGWDLPSDNNRARRDANGLESTLSLLRQR